MNFTRKLVFTQMLKICPRHYSQVKESQETVVVNPVKKIKRLEYNDSNFSNLMLTLKSKKGREKSGLIYLEGKRLIQDAFNVGIKPKTIFFTKKDDLDSIGNLDEDIKLYKMPYKDMQIWSDLTTCPGIIAICKEPQPVPLNEKAMPVTVVCDQVREPGNLGAIIRCAAAASAQKVVLMKGCVDQWNSKVIRGASGAHFRIPVMDTITWDKFPEYFNTSTNFLLASNHHSSEKHHSLPCHRYYDIDYKEKDGTVIVIGGETEGLSDDAYELAKEFSGKFINIPLSNNVESLNCVSAMSIILFEMNRQLLQ